MEKYSIEIAKKSDDTDLREVLRRTQMKGDISLSFETNPSFFKSISILGEKQTVLSIRENKKNQIIGFLIRSTKNVFINGKIQKVGYLSSIRLLEEHRGGRLLIQGNKELKKLLEKSKEEINFTTIIEDNMYARKVIAKSRAGLPNYMPIGINRTFAIKPIKKSRHQSSKNITIQKGIDGFSIMEIIKFINYHGSKKNFFPVCSKKLFQENMLEDFYAKDLYIAYKDKKILGVIGTWDQSKFKQTIVKGLSTKYKVLRIINNYILTHIINTPIISNVNEKINALYLNFIAIDNNDTNIFSSLIDNISIQNAEKSYNYLLIGIDKNDPLCKSMSKFRSFTYNAIIYIVDYSNINIKSNQLNYLEVSRL